MKRIVSLSLLLLAALILSACGATTSATPTPTAPIRIGNNGWAGSGAAYIADSKGLFAQNGLSVQLVQYSTANDVLADFASKKIDISMGVMSDAIAQAAAGIPVQMIWATDTSNGGDVVVGNSSITSPGQLRGKKVGLSYGTFSQIFVLQGLAKFGLSESDVTIVNVSEDQVPAALKDGRIDAGHTWDPFLTQAVNDGGHILFTSADTPGIIADGLFAQSSLIQQHPHDVQTLVNTIAAAQTWWNANQDEGNQIVAKVLGVPEAEMPSIIQGLKLFSLEDNLTAFNPSTQGADSLFQTGQFISNIFVQKNIIQQAPDMQTLLNATFIQAAPHS